MKTTATTPMSRLVLLCKAQGDFKHSGKYYLQGGRWHAFKHDKPVPKGAPVAAHPHAAGKFVPKQHFSDAEWQQLKLPAENTNAGSFNKLLDQLKQHSDSGDVTAILGMQYGTNTYGKKGATIANHLLGQYGSEHKVMPGQKAGEHAAVSQAPAEPASAATITDVTPAGYGIDEPAGPEHAPGSYPDVYGQIIKLNDAGDAAGLNKLADGLPNSGEMLALKKLAQQKAEKLAPAADDWKPSYAEVMSTKDSSPEEVKAKMKEWAQKMGGIDKLAALLEDYSKNGNHKKATAAQPKASEPVPTFSVGDTVEPGQMKHLKPGTVVQMEVNGKPWRNALVGTNAVWFSKMTGDKGWQKNPVAPQHLSSFKSGQYGAAKVLEVGAANWLPEQQKAMAAKLLDHKQEKNQNAKAYKMGAMVVVGEVGKPNTFAWIGESGDWAVGFTPGQMKKLQIGEGLEPISLGEQGPKEGDTKPAADGGTLVLKDGRWTKQEGDKPKMGPVGQALKEATSKPAADPMGSFASLKGDIDEAAAAGHINALKDIEAYLTKPQNKSEPGAAATLAYLNSKKEQASHGEWLAKMKGNKTIELDGKPWYVLNEGTVHANGTTHAHLASADEGKAQPNGWNPKQISTDVVTSLLHQKAGALAMPEFAEGKTKAGVKAYYEAKAQTVLDLAAAGDADGLAKLKHYGSKPNAKGKVSNTWAGKTANSKTLIALHQQAMELAGGNKPVSAEPEAPGISSSTPVPAKTKKILDDLAASGDKFSLTMMATSNEDVNPHIAAYANKLIAGIPDEPSPAEKIKQATQAATASVAQDPGFKEAVSIAQAATAGDASSKVSQIPWDSQLLPDSNSNAKSHNGKVAQIKAMAEAGDLAGLEAFKAGKNTYGQKQMKLAAVAIAALKESAPAAKTAPIPMVEKPSIGKITPEILDTVISSADSSEAALKAAKLYILDGGPSETKVKQVIDTLEKYGFNSVADEYKHSYGMESSKAPSTPTISDLVGQAGSAHAAQVAVTKHLVKNNESPAAYDEAIAALKEHGYDGAAKAFAEIKEEEHGSQQPAPGTKGSINGVEYTATDLGWVSESGSLTSENGNIAAALDMTFGFKPTDAWYKKSDNHKHATAEMAVDNGLDPAKALSLAFPVGSENGPQEGDTKTINGVTYVLHNGRWHKQGEAESAPADQHPLDAIEVPDLSDLNYPQKAASLLEYLKQKVKDEGPSALKGVTKKMSSTGKLITKLPTPDGGTYKITGYESLTSKSHNKVFEYVEALKAAAGAPKKAAPKAKAAAPVYASNGIQSMDSWKQTGPQGGSNPGGKFKDENGTEWYCKFPGDEDMAKSEVLAAQLYAIAGIAGQDAKLITKDGKLGIASKWTTVKKASPAQLASTEGVASGFGVDAWLGNWDVVGMQFDNLQVGDNGKAVRVDAGGSLTYRAQGGKKQFGTTVLEIDSLRDKAINPQAAAVFGNLTKADITASVAKVLAIPDSAIINAVEMYGPGDAANKKALADVLLARKADLAAKFPKAVKAPKKRLDPSHLPVNPDDLPKAHDFSNWLGTGKPLSSQPHVNAANASVEQELLASALAGNLTRLKDFKFHAIDKATGNATGQMHPIAQHPSKHVVQLHADLVQLLDEIANPPEPLKVFQETDVGTIEQLSASLPPKKFGTTVSAVSSNEKLGFWVVLGTAHGAQKFKPSKVMDYSTAAIAAGHEKYKQASKLAKHFINSVQASGSYNDLFRNGAKEDHQGNKLADVAQAALAHATSMPEGTSLYRWQNMPDEMVKKMLAAPDGSVFQATGPMCTSYHPTATSGFGQHRVTIRYAKGAKAVESFGSGGFKGEKEVTTLPNSRFIILSKQMVPNEKNPSKQRLELEVLMLPPDLGI